MSSNSRANFEKQLRDKLAQKTSSFGSEEAVLIKNFKFFDLDNSGTVEFDEFKKAIEKIGVQVRSPQELKDLFNYYDTNRNGVLEYKEFASIIFGNASPVTRQKSPDTQKMKYKDTSVGLLLDKVRDTLRKRGTSILSLGRQFTIADRNNSRTLDKEEFINSMKTFGTGLDPTEASIVFNHFDADRSGQINYDEFIFGVAGEMNSFRRKLVEQAFNQLDKNASGDITVDDLVHVYDASHHPDVRSGKKTENQVLNEFLKNFETLYDFNRIDDDRVTKDEFIQYYNFLSASIEGDQYFETMINNSWHINEPRKTAPRGWMTQVSTKQQQQPQETEKRGGRFDPAEKTKQSAIPQNNAEIADRAIDKLRNTFYQRGAKSFIGLQRQFKIADDDNDKAITFSEFQKVCTDFKLGLTPEEIKALFIDFDVDGSGRVSIDEFVRGVRGEMNEFRRNLVIKAFNVLDRDGDGVVRVNDIKSIYSAKSHPEVRSGRKTESEVLGEFLETFESHHNIRHGTKDQNVTLEEFIEYYNNVGANIDDDKQFELMIHNGYKLGSQQGYESRPAWGQSYKGTEAAKNKARNHVTVAPYGVSEGKTDYSTSQKRPETSQSQSQSQGYERVKSTSYGSYGVADPIQQQQQQSRGGSGDVLESFRKKLNSRGTRGILSLARLFKIIDDNNNRTLDQQEFAKCLADLRLNFSPEEVRALFSQFDTDRSGLIDYDEFLRVVRGPLNQNRAHWVKEAFKKLDADGSGVINIQDLKGRYSAKQHPDVKNGRRSEDEVLTDFLDTFEQHHAVHTGDFKGRDSQVTLEEFFEYYNNISSSIDDDKYFEAMIKSAWKLDGPTTTQSAWKGDYGKYY